MADDFVLNVKQISQYPLATATGPGDFYLLQRGGVGGAYMSIPPSTLLNTALNLGGFINLAPNGTGGLAFNGATLTFDGVFTFDEGASFAGDVQVPSLHSAGDIFVAGEALASQVYVTGLFDSLLQNSVTSFNGRIGAVQLEDLDILRAGGVLATNPHFHGVVTAPTLWNFSDCSDAVATTAWVQGAIINAGNTGAMVRSFNGRGGCVLLTADDITFALTQPGVYALANTPPTGDTSKRLATTMFVDNAMADVQGWTTQQINNIANQLDQQYAPLNSPQFTGVPTAPTAAQTVNSGQLATTAFVHAAVTASTTGVASWNGRTGAVTLTTADVTGAGGAPIASPTFTGIAAAPTAVVGTSTTQLATTAFVQAALGTVAAGVTSFNTRTGAVTLQTADVTGVGGALLASPALSGTPTAPTAAPATNNTQLATTAYVTTAIAALPAPVTSFNGRVGAITFQASDISAAGGALLASPNFTGTPTAPTQAPGTSNTDIATTAFVANAVAGSTAGVTSFNTRTGAVTLTTADVTGAGGAVLASPAFTGVPTAPTATAGTNSTQLATTAFVTAALAASPGGVTSFNGRTGAITLQGSDVSAAGGALLASPAFTGTPTSPTPVPGTNNTDIATTAFVANAISTAGGVNTFNGRAGAVTLNTADVFGANGATWVQADTAPAFTNNRLWFDSSNGQLYVQYVDPVSSAQNWVVANSPMYAGGAVIGIRTFAASGTYTPNANMKTCIIECVGGGGGGAGISAPAGWYQCGGGGGGGGYARKFATAATVGASQVVTVSGITGNAAAGAAGANGGSSSVGSLATANGGAGGSGQTGGTGGTASGDFAITGKTGNAGTSINTNIGGISGGGGGDSFLGFGGPSMYTAASATGANYIGYGGGGSGGVAIASSAGSGGAGGGGVVIITEFS